MPDTITAVIRAYDRQTHTATVQPEGSTTYLHNIPVAHHLQWWHMQIGYTCALFLFDPSDITNACIAFVFGNTPPDDPRFDPIIGHQHRGIQDDAPVLP